MSVKPDTETLAALAGIGKRAEWVVIETWLLRCREDCVQRSLGTDEVQSRQAQGWLMAIDDFVKNTRAAVDLSTRR